MKRIFILLCVAVVLVSSFPQRHRKKPNRHQPGGAGFSGSAANAGCN